MKILITSEQIQQRVADLAMRIAGDYGEQPLTIVGVLTGSLMFLADLVRRLEIPVRLGLIQASSYRGTATEPGRLEIGPELLPDLRSRHVLLLDDILDTGRTLNHLVQRIRQLDPASLKIAVLLRKRGRQHMPINPDYCGFEIPDCFAVGYGLDFNDQYRNLPFVGTMD